MTLGVADTLVDAHVMLLETTLLYLLALLSSVLAPLPGMATSGSRFILTCVAPSADSANFPQ